jgi:hypothetical protein
MVPVPKSFRLLAAGSLLALVPALLPAAAIAAGAAPAARSHVAGPDTAVLTIDGIDRDGTSLGPVSASVIGLNGQPYLSGGSSVSLPPGTYLVAAPLWRPADGGNQTMVAATVHMTSAAKTVTLDGQGAVPIQSSLTASQSATQGTATVSLCTGGNTLSGLLVEPGGTIYVQPISSKHLQMVYQSYYQGTGTLYEVAASDSHGIPASPDYHASQSAMAKVNMQLRANENVTPLQSMISGYANCGSIDLPETLLPDVYTDYRTPGAWNINLNFGPSVGQPQRDLFKQGTYHAGHTYTDIYDSAVAGPGSGRDAPVADGSAMTYAPGSLFADPLVATGLDCEGTAKVTLARSGKKLKSQQINFCAKHSVFSAHQKHSGWYTLTAAAARLNPSGSVPGFMLSSQMDMSWRFHYSPVHGHPVNVRAMAVTVPQFEPQGIGAYNDAEGGTTTTVKLLVARAGGEPVQTPRYALRPVKVWVSFDNGASWQKVTASKHGGHWLVKISNPADGGVVSLRTTVTDVHGDSTSETVIGAYLVDNSG